MVNVKTYSLEELKEKMKSVTRSGSEDNPDNEMRQE
jgi:hypothetical protein